MSATLTYYIQVQLIENKTNIVYKNAPSGTKVFFRINNFEYNPDAQGVTVYETEVDAQGIFTFEISVTEVWNGNAAEEITTLDSPGDIGFNYGLNNPTASLYMMFHF